MNRKKELMEKCNGIKAERAVKVKAMEDIANHAAEETRGLTDEEKGQVEALEKEIEGLDTQERGIQEVIDLIERTEQEGLHSEGEEMRGSEQQKTQERAFVAFVRGEAVRAGELTLENGQALVPKTIADRIITRVKELSPIYERATKYNVKGTLTIPYYDEGNGPKMVYATEFKAPDASAGNFKSVDLNGYLASCLAMVSVSLVNNSEQDVLGFIIEEVAKAAAFFIEHECLVGTSDKVEGLSKVEATVTKAAVDLDALIEVQNELVSTFQGNAIWIMSRKNSLAIKLLKDTNKRPILNIDPTVAFGQNLLGKGVYVSENCPDDVIFYGDFSGLSVKMAEESSIQVLRERYADMHAIGVIDWIEIDAKVSDAQKIKKLKIGE